MDMILEGNVGAMKIAVDTIGRKAVQLLRKRADRLSDLGADADRFTIKEGGER